MREQNPAWISEWNPEDQTFWTNTGKAIARRNLIWSIVAEHIGFSVWLIWSIVATKLPQAGFHYSTDELFQLVAVPGLIGALMRFPYTFAVTTFGGRNWTIFSASVLFIPTLALAYFVSHPETPFWLMLLIACTAGLGGGNFASSMTNISFFYPDRMKGWALGLNAAGGNIGVSSVQLLTPILMGLGLINLYQANPVGGVYLQNAGLMWVVPIAIAVFGAVLFMNNLTSAKSSIKNQLAIIKRKHTWVMSIIYIGTFGSFIGYSAAFPLLIKTQFPAVTISIAFLGPLVGSLARPLGGLLADKIGGAILTFFNFIAMVAATVGVLYFVGAKDFTGFLMSFLVLFVTTGIGNGSTYRMIPSIFREENLHKVKGQGEVARAAALKTASVESGAAVGFIGAIGAVGGYFIPSGFGKSIAATGGPQTALVVYLAFYAICLTMTWWFYLRRNPQTAGAPSLAEARI
ncbi:MAG: MFS transporter [Bradyrhizobium sp.]|jgi:MFS transporter, NNP family, nitrate/nitrite transporter|uniref:MFS transporter n=1 Tax=Bradyrhizobium sp. TaxID=376 RepID=UPI003C7B2AC9